MKKVLYFLPILFLACEPQALPDLSLANLNGSWQVQANGRVYPQDSASIRLERLDFVISFSENAQFVITEWDSVPHSGSYQQLAKGELQFPLPGFAIKEGFQDLNLVFRMNTNLQVEQEWYAYGSGIFENQAADYDIIWEMKRLE